MTIRKNALRTLLMIAVIFAFLTVFPAGRQTAYAASGKWVKADGVWKFRKPNGKYVTGMKKIGRYHYYFNKDGSPASGWVKIGNYTYYCMKSKVKGKSGRIYAGWHKVDGDWRYFSQAPGAPEHGAMAVGWKKINSRIYCFTEDGRPYTGLRKIDGYYYYFTKSYTKVKRGRLYTGFKRIHGKLRYFRKTGKLGTVGRMSVSTSIVLGGKTYYFDSNGVASTTPPATEASTSDSTSGGTDTAADETEDDDDSDPMGGRTYTQEEKDSFISKLAPLAVADMHQSGIFASVTIAQGILESAYGTTKLAVKANNLFGMKAVLSHNNWLSPWNGKTYTKTTKEWSKEKGFYKVKAKFRKYESWAVSVADHSAYLLNARNDYGELRYEGIKDAKTPREQIKLIKKCGYATDPAYVSSIMRVINENDLTKYDAM